MNISLKRRTHEFLELSVIGDKWGRIFDTFMMVLIVANVIAIVLETLPDMAVYSDAYFTFEVISVAIFTIEYVLRVWSCTANIADGYEHPLKGRLRYMVTPLAIIDLLAFLPFYLSAFFAIDLRILRLFRLLRLLKLTRYSPALLIIWAVIRGQYRALMAALFVMVIALLFSSSLIFVFEKDVQPEAFGSIPHAMWWGIATLTTVGYGDVTPITMGGRIFGAFTMILGIGMFALPTGVIASGFANEVRKHDFIVSWRLIAKVPLFSTLDAAHIAEIANLLTPLVVPPRHAVVRLGEKADCMFFIITGDLEVEIPPNPIKLHPGEFFGEVGMMKNSVRSADVISLTECQLLELTAENFWRLVHEHPEIGDMVQEIINQRPTGFDDLTTEAAKDA